MDTGQGLFERGKVSSFLRVLKKEFGEVKAVRPWYTGGRKEEWHLNKARLVSSTYAFSYCRRSGWRRIPVQRVGLFCAASLTVQFHR